MLFDFGELDRLSRYKLLGSTILPVPIAWVSTIGSNGQLNAAPFSFFNVFSEDPPVLGFSVANRSEHDRKDTGDNIRLQEEFVVNLVSEPTVEQMNISSIDFPPDVSEFAEASLTAAASTHIATPRIASSVVAFECKLLDIVSIGAMRSLVLGEVLAMHIAEDAVIDAERCYIDSSKLKLVGRMHANSYIRTLDTFEIPRITLEGWTARRETD